MELSGGEVTELLKKWRGGDRSAEGELFRLVMPDLQRMARYYLSREKPDQLLQASALVNEIYLKLVGARDEDWQNRQHFFALAARAMRRYLIDCARVRPKGEFVTFDEMAEMRPPASNRLEIGVAVDALLDELEHVHPEWCSIVELKFFLGLTDEEGANALGIPLRTFQRRFSDARRWLFERLHDDHASRD